MTDVSIGIYKDAFRKDVSELIITIQKDEFEMPISLASQPDLDKIPEFYQVDKGNFWIAREGDRVIGTIALQDIGNNRCALRKMFVLKDYRGSEKGVGQSLLDHAINWARYKGIAEIILGTTEKFIAARRFYEKNGFTEIQKRELPVTFPVMDVDTRFYRYSVY
jgi:N-acetylglutamate synthase-like GNAT family acetyltransferase